MWWNKGIAPGEGSMSLRELWDNDKAQRTVSDKAFKKGSNSLKDWRPHKAFTPKMLSTGPTPLVRYALPRVAGPLGVGYTAYDLTNKAMDTDFADSIGMGRQDIRGYGREFYKWLDEDNK
jgi:hypothetical protein